MNQRIEGVRNPGFNFSDNENAENMQIPSCEPPHSEGEAELNKNDSQITFKGVEIINSQAKINNQEIKEVMVANMYGEMESRINTEEAEEEQMMEIDFFRNENN